MGALTMHAEKPKTTQEKGPPDRGELIIATIVTNSIHCLAKV